VRWRTHVACHCSWSRASGSDGAQRRELVDSQCWHSLHVSRRWRCSCRQQASDSCSENGRASPHHPIAAVCRRLGSRSIRLRARRRRRHGYHHPACSPRSLR
jgi:hypothetical protein